MMDEKCLSPELWYACAGEMVQIPPLTSQVFYFPQGHAEHACGPVRFTSLLPPYVLCTLTSLKYMADPHTDELFAKLSLLPLNLNHHHDDAELPLIHSKPPHKLPSFAKTLTQSDANNGGGFSVPRYCAEKMFPPLDFSKDPPLQYITAKDVHGESWRFKHIYRGTPRRHLLTTGWSPFVNNKKLVAGDSVVFLKANNNDLYVGIRRAKRGNGVRFHSSLTSNSLPYGGAGLSGFLREDDRKRKLVSINNEDNIGVMNSSASVMGEAVIEAANLAAQGRAFDVTYYPRASTPEFCVKASLVKNAMHIKWYSGLRFKMALQTQDSSRITWFIGTISSVEVADPLLWPSSPWRILQVKWDEADLLENVKRVSPWSVELLTDMPAIPPPLSPSPKKLRLLQHPHFPPLDPQLYLPTMFSTHHLIPPPNNPYAYHHPPAGMQGARQAFCALSLLNPNPAGHLLTPALRPPIHHSTAIQTRLSKNTPTLQNPSTSENVSCLLSKQNSTHSRNNPPDDVKTPPHLVLFGKVIRTHNHSSCDAVSPVNLETDHCKVFLDTEDLGRTMNLSLLGSYDELYRKLTEMFGILISDAKMLNRVIYQDIKGEIKRVRDEPFR
ncbi:auxin response factor 18-like [Senna tora]|uniref:Auxin response factor n=1 Tax=Senna tora TaxID=362788 RepID=A0A834SIW2_9FABA|nr:auxin response factor 18-like [Senna tora]